MRALFDLGIGIARRHFQGELQQAVQLGGRLLGLGIGAAAAVESATDSCSRNCFHAQEHGGEREGSLVGAADNKGLLADLVGDDARCLEVLHQWERRIGVRYLQLVDFVQGANGRPVADRCGVVHVLDLAAARLGQGGRAVLEDEHVVPKLAPGANLAFGHGLAIFEIFGERHAGGLGRHHKVVQIDRHPVGDAAVYDGIRAFHGVHLLWHLSRFLVSQKGCYCTTK